jgi:hypothetical protein
MPPAISACVLPGAARSCCARPSPAPRAVGDGRPQAQATAVGHQRRVLQAAGRAWRAQRQAPSRATRDPRATAAPMLDDGRSLTEEEHDESTS